MLSLKDIKKDYVVGDSTVSALKGVSIDFRENEFVSILGPSGCGKTTTLRIIGGFVEPDSGDVIFGGKRINGTPPNKRNVNTVFQKYSLFPHLNVFDNVAFGLKLKKMPKDEIKKRVTDMLATVDLKGYEKRSVAKLSGGQQQRVAIARALELNPDVLCFDEPSSALDPEVTCEVLNVIRSLKTSDSTMIVVTHEIEFARDVADKIIFMADGVIAEEGTPEQVINNPQNPRTQAFLSRFK